MNIVILSLHVPLRILCTLLFITLRVYSGEPYTLSQILVLGGSNEIHKVATKLRTSHGVRVQAFETNKEQTEEKHSEGFLTIHPTGGALCCSSQDGLYAAFSSYDMGIILWDLASGMPHHISTDNTSKLLFSPKSTFLAWRRQTFPVRDDGYHDASDYGQQIVLFDMLAGKTVKIISTEDYVDDICFSQDDTKLIASYKGGISTWNLRGRKGEPETTFKLGEKQRVINLRSSKGGHVIGLERTDRKVFLWQKALLSEKSLLTPKGRNPQNGMFLSYNNQNSLDCHLEFITNQTFGLVTLNGSAASCSASAHKTPTITEFSDETRIPSNQSIQKIIYPTRDESVCIVTEDRRPIIDRKIITHHNGVQNNMLFPREATGPIALSDDGNLMIVDIETTNYDPQLPMKILYAYQKIENRPFFTFTSTLSDSENSLLEPSKKSKKRKKHATRRRKSKRHKDVLTLVG